MLRRALGKKDPVAMAQERGKIVSGAKQLHHIDEAVSNAIFDILNKFAGYGFNKSHSAAYAILSYQTGYLKANYPVHFMAAVLSSELGNAEKVSHFIDEAMAMGIPVLGPDVNESREMFTPVFRQPADGRRTAAHPGPPGADTAPHGGAAIRFGLAGIKGVGEQAAERILAERAAAGPYQDFHDFLLRADSRAINKRVLENLVATGAFDFSGAPREELFDQIDGALSALGELLRKYPALRPDVPEASRPAETTETMLFDLAGTTAPAPLPDRPRLAREFAELLRHTRKAPAVSAAAPGAGDHALLDLGAGAHAPVRTNGGRTAATPAPERLFTAATRLQFEKELLGFYISGHPMNAFAGLAEAINTVPEDQLRDLPDRSEFRVCGVASAITKKLSKKDNRPWAAFTLATKRLSLPMNMFSEAYEAYARNLVAEMPVLVQGNVLAGTDGVRINVKVCYPLEAIVASLIRKVTWLLHPGHPGLPAFLRALRSTVDASCGDTRIEFAFVFDGRIAPFADASPALGWKIVPAQFQQLRLHPAVAGTLFETKSLQLKETRRWAKH